MADMRKVEATVGEVLKERRSDLPIESIRVEPSLDMDDDEIPRVAVIYDAKRKRPDPGRVSTAARRMRPRLAAIGERAFPMTSRISGADWRSARRSRTIRLRPRGMRGTTNTPHPELAKRTGTFPRETEPF